MKNLTYSLLMAFSTLLLPSFAEARTNSAADFNDCQRACADTAAAPQCDVLKENEENFSANLRKISGDERVAVLQQQHISYQAVIAACGGAEE